MGISIATSIIGASEETIDKTLAGDITETITTAGNITQTINAIEYTVTNTSPTYKSTNTGNSDFFQFAESKVVAGVCTDTFMGIKNENFFGLKITNIKAGEVKISDASDLNKQSTTINDVATSINKVQTRIIDGSISIIKSKMNMIG